MGLMFISLELYFKVVYAVAHRKYYRSWMTKVGVALPWVVGTCYILFPLIATTSFVDGQCQVIIGIWPNTGVAKVRYYQ